MARILCLSFLIALLSGCAHSPPYRDFEPRHPVARGAIAGAGIGTAIGAAATGTVAGALIGTAAGGTLGALVSSGRNPQQSLINTLAKQNIQFVRHGDTLTLIVPTDKYYLLESPRFNEVCHAGLQNIIALLRLYPHTPIYVAGFTDDVGSRLHKKRLSQAQAETMMTFLWANGISAQRLKVEGYGDKYDIADNKLIHGSAMNRRIEIQWLGQPYEKCCLRPVDLSMK